MSKTYGHKGVGWDKRSDKWRVQIWVHGATKHVGCFDTMGLATSAYAAARDSFVQSGAIKFPVDPVEQKKRWRSTNKESVAKSNRRYRANHKEHLRMHDKRKKWELRLEIIRIYGGRCECCREMAVEFLTVDHIGGGGRKHKESIGVSGGYQFYLWLKKQAFPTNGYRLLCYNCNCAIGHLGYCPHQTTRPD